MEKIKNNLADLVCAVTGLLTLIFFFLPYISDTSGEVTSSGFNVLGMLGGELTLNFMGQSVPYEFNNISGNLAAVAQIIVLLGAILLLVMGACRLLKAFGILATFPDKFGKKSWIQLYLYGLVATVVGNIMATIFTFALLADDGMRGLETASGLYINLVFSIVAVIVFIYALKVMVANKTANNETQQ